MTTSDMPDPANSGEPTGWNGYAVVMLDAQGHVTAWTAGAERMSGYSAREIIGQHFSRLYAEDARTAAAPFAALEHAQHHGRYESTVWRLRKDGTRFSASVLIEAVRSSAGAVTGFVEIVRDNNVRGQLRHDFNNVAQIVTTTLNALRLHTAGDARTAELIEIIQRNATVATDMVQRLVADAGVDEAEDVHNVTAQTMAGLRVFVVEDESLIAMHIEDMLHDLGCEVVASASSLERALALASEVDADFALIDVNLQGQRAYPVASALMARGVPFAFMSGETPTDAEWAKHPIVQKPLQSDQMRQQIERALGRA